MLHSLMAGAIAGAAGELALNVVAYGDMLARARPPSTLPADVAGRLADAAGIDLAETRRPRTTARTRREAAGALLGYGMALSVAIGYASLRRLGLRLPAPLAGLAMGGVAMAVSDTTATALGVTDPSTWGAEGWISDIVPHAAYGLVAAATLEAIDP